LAIAKRVAPSTRSLVIGKDVSRADREGASRLGAVRVLPKPLSLLDLGDAVDLAAECAEGFHGWLHGLALPDVLQMFHMSCATLSLSIHGTVDGRLVFNRGQIVHAECQETTGRTALALLLAVRTGRLDTSAADLGIMTIDERFDRVILDALRVVDESRRRPSVVPFARKNPSGEYAFAELFEDAREHPTWRPPPPAPEVLEPLAPAAIHPGDDRSPAIRHALAQHSPGAYAWICDPSAGSIERVDEWDSPEDLGNAVAAFGIALDLAERSDPSWTSVELGYGGFVVALIRQPKLVLAVARVSTGEDLLRRFRVDVNALRRYWLSEAHAL
jgi:Domain of unknown function (DUF4388)